MPASTRLDPAVFELRFEQITVGENVRRFQGDVDALAKQIAATGWIAPLQVRPAERGKYLLRAGHRRHEAVRRLRAAGDERFELVPVQIAEARAVKLLENLGREPMRPVEILATFEALRHGGSSVREIAEEHGLSAAYVYEVLSLAKLHPDVRAQLDRGNNALGLRRLGEIARLPRDEQLRAFDAAQGLVTARKGKLRLTRTRVKRLINRYQTEPDGEHKRGALEALRELIGE